METNTNRQTHKRTFSESDSNSRTERYLCSFTHLWIIKYSSFLLFCFCRLIPQFSYLSSYIDDPNSTYLQSETFSPVNTPYSNTRWSLKLYPRGLNEKQTTTTATTTNNNNNNNTIAIFLKYVCGTIPTIKAKAEFSVVSRNNDLVLLRSTNFHTFSSGNDWGYSEFLDGNYLNSRRHDLLTDDRLRVYVRVILVDEKEPLSHELFSSQSVHSSKSQQASSSSIQTTNSHLQHSSSRLFSTDKDRLKSFELLSKQIHTLFDDQRFTDMNIHVIPKQDSHTEEQKKSSSHRLRRTSIKQQVLCQCQNSAEQTSEQHEFDLSTSRRTTRSLTSRLARTSSNCSSSSSDHCSSSLPKACSCQTSFEQEPSFDLSVDYSQVIPLATFHVHKAILIARSSLFAHQIRRASSSTNLYIDDLQPVTVRTMLIYIYTGQLPNITDEIYQNLNLIDLFRASVKYNLHELRHLTKTTMLDNLKIENAIEMLEISDQANDQEFKQHVLSFIRSNALAISKTTNWIDCTKQNPQLIIDAFRSLVTPTITKYSNHYHHSISLTTGKQSKND